MRACHACACACACAAWQTKKQGAEDGGEDGGGGPSFASSLVPSGALNKVLQSAFASMVARSANGIFSVGIYFADLVSDLQVHVHAVWSRRVVTPCGHAVWSR